MKLLYDSTIKLASFSPTAWAEVGLRRWLPNHKVLTRMDFGALNDALGNINIRGVLADLGMTMGEFIDSRAYLEWAASKPELHGYSFTVSKNIAKIGDFAANCSRLASLYENKVRIRQHTTGLPFPRYHIIDGTELRDMSFREAIRWVASNAVVIQHEALSGGLGTYIVKNEYEWEQTQQSVVSRGIDTSKFVLSQFIANARELSIQCCIAKGEVLVGPLQQQLVRDALLTSPDKDVMQFCGGRIDRALVDDSTRSIIETIAQKAGALMMHDGYIGMFGLDVGVSEAGVHLFEVNARKTAITPLLLSIQEDVPFALIEALESIGQEYTIVQDEHQKNPVGGSFVVVYATKQSIVRFETGLYDYNLQRIGDGFERNSLLPQNDGELFIAMRDEVGSQTRVGKSLAMIYSREQLFTDSQLNTIVESMVAKTRE